MIVDISNCALFVDEQGAGAPYFSRKVSGSFADCFSETAQYDKPWFISAWLGNYNVMLACTKNADMTYFHMFDDGAKVRAGIQ